MQQRVESALLGVGRLRLAAGAQRLDGQRDRVGVLVEPLLPFLAFEEFAGASELELPPAELEQRALRRRQMRGRGRRIERRRQRVRGAGFVAAGVLHLRIDQRQPGLHAAGSVSAITRNAAAASRARVTSPASLAAATISASSGARLRVMPSAV